MTYITGYENRKGPYINGSTSAHSGNASNKNTSNDYLIWSVSAINTANTPEEKLQIWDNAASTDFTDSNNRHNNYRILSLCLDGDTGADAASDTEGWLSWDFETPILARNGFYGLGDTNIDWSVWYTVLPQNNPYDTATGASVTSADKAKRATLVPNLVCCRMDSMGPDDSASVTSKTLSERDCEIWGVWAWNSVDNEGPKMLRINNGSSAIASFRLGQNDQNNAGIHKQFKIPLYAKGGIEVRSLTEGGSTTNGHGVNCSVLFREFEHSGRDLDSSARL